MFERAVIRRLSDACGGSSSCDADGFITYIGEKQVWYNAGRPSGQANPQDLERLFGNGSYMEHLDAFGRWWSDSSSAVQEGCQGFSCSWGNCRLDLRSGQYNYPESLRWIYYRDEASDFYVREPFPSPGDVIFIVGGYEP